MNTFPPEIETGNVRNEMKVPNRVFNQLKLHSYAEEKRMNRIHDKSEQATTVRRQTKICFVRKMFFFFSEFRFRSENPFDPF